MITQRELANTIRILSMDAVEKAKSGHPGAPMGMADIAEVLWRHHLKYNPANPKWVDRDRFVLSNGHGSMLLYALLYLTGYDMTIDDLKQFRQLHAKTPGHPEYGYADGIETTTGPLGQGIANAVGFALAERTLGAYFNRPGLNIVDHYTYVFLGDGCLMEGISHEVCSLAGTLGLGKLIAFWDDNNVSIDGQINDWMETGVARRFASYNWQVIKIDGHDPQAVNDAIIAAKLAPKPSLICCKTVIGYGAPNKAGSHNCHGAPLGAEECDATRDALNWQHEPFVVPDEIKQAWSHIEQGAQDEALWNNIFAEYQRTHPELAQEFVRRIEGKLPGDFIKHIDAFIAQTQRDMPALASRQASQKVIEQLSDLLPELFGGSADLTGSNLTNWSDCVWINRDTQNGNYLSYGVREFGMAAILNGITLHGGLRAYAGTFLMFMEYMRNAVRMAALMKIPTIFVYSHDSIGLGEDGPTHQPVEQLAILRLTPNMVVWRPCDATESAIAWKMALLRQTGPTALAFSRQKLEPIKRTDEQLALVEKGAYVLFDCDAAPQLILISTGSEVAITLQAAQVLTASGHAVRVVSMPSSNVFDQQDQAYQHQVLIPGVKCLAVEAGVCDFWAKYVGLDGGVVGMDTFGESAPGGILFETFGFTVDNIVQHARQLIESIPKR